MREGRGREKDESRSEIREGRGKRRKRGVKVEVKKRESERGERGHRG